MQKKSEDKLKELLAQDTYNYTLGYGDVINISLTDIEDIDGSYTISPDGSVTIPYVGQVIVNDKTKEEAQLNFRLVFFLLHPHLFCCHL